MHELGHCILTFCAQNTAYKSSCCGSQACPWCVGLRPVPGVNPPGLQLQCAHCGTHQPPRQQGPASPFCPLFLLCFPFPFVPLSISLSFPLFLFLCISLPPSIISLPSQSLSPAQPISSLWKILSNVTASKESRTGFLACVNSLTRVLCPQSISLQGCTDERWMDS